jgi:UV DNA damage endonuclease
MSNRIGYACKTSQLLKGVATTIPELNNKTTTAAFLSRLTSDRANQKLTDLAKHNIQALKDAIKYVATLPPNLRMFRIGSDILPMYTHEQYAHYWQSQPIQEFLQHHLAQIGTIARSNNIRLSMHPGQFVCLASENPAIVANSIAEFEYHATVAQYMGYGNTWQDFKINVHVSGKLGIAGMRTAYNQLSTHAKNCITVENDEYSCGLEQCLELADIIPTVLDLHHHYIKTGEYILATDPRILAVKSSWRGVTPTIHYSQSREDVLVGHDPNTLPDLQSLIANGHRKQKLRAHSDYYWNHAVNAWAKTHTSWADIMCESKAKNLASHQLATEWTR